MRVVLSGLALILCLPAPGFAKEIVFVISNEVAVSFGLDAFRISHELYPYAGVGEDVFVDRGWVEFVSGPLTARTVDDTSGDVITSYLFKPGKLVVDLLAFDNDGNEIAGRFRASTLAFQVDVCEGCDALFDASSALDFEILLGAGRFSATLARLLGVERETSGGSLPLGLDGIDGDGASASRIGFSHTGEARIAVNAVAAPDVVPEPGLVALSLPAIAGWLVRRTRARRPHGAR